MSEPSAAVPLLASVLPEGAWRDALAALSSLYGEFVTANAARRNPLEGGKRPDKRADAIPAAVLTGRRERRRLLDTPPADTLKGLRDRTVHFIPYRGTIG